MADVSDVEIALREAVQAVRDVAFPGVPVYRGWPSADRLDAAAKAGLPIVTVMQRIGFARDDTRYENFERDLPQVAPSLTVTVSGLTATFAGTCSTDQIAGVQVGNTAWVRRCVSGDTPATVASILAGASGGAAFGASVTLTGLAAARTGRDGATLRLTRQQEVGFAVIVWSPDPPKRDSIASAFDVALSNTQFLALADGSAGHLRWSGTTSTDKTQVADFYRRDLFYTVNFSTTIAAARPVALFPTATINNAGPYAPQGATL